MPALRVADADDAPEKPPRTTSTPALQEQATLVDQHADVAVRGPEVLTSTTGIHDPVDLVRRKQAAESGDVAEQLALGVMYGNGEGVPEDLIEAVKWLLLAAKQGDANAQSYLGFMYGEGRGVQEDPAEAARWFRLAAEQGEPYAQFMHGAAHATGVGVPKNPAEAARWYRLAATTGLADAQLALGDSYVVGVGVPKDAMEAAKWYRLAAEQGNAYAQFRLGAMYANGAGVPKDAVQAYAWINLAAASSIAGAADARDLLARRMTSAQIAEAQEISRRFRPRSVPVSEDQPMDDFALEPGSTGSGFFVTSEGHFVTSAHVVAEGARFAVQVGGRSFAARVLRRDTANDLALLKCEGAFQSVPVRSSSRARLGDRVSTVGFPNPGLQGETAKFTSGTISALSGIQDDPRFFQVSIPVQPGNSGGPLLDATGAAIGVIAARLDGRTALSASGALPENVNYAVKGSHLLTLLESIPDLAERVAVTSYGKFLSDSEVAASAEAACGLVLVYR